MSVPQALSPIASLLDPVAVAWLSGGLPRAIDTVLVSRLDRRQIRVVDGDVVDRGLDRSTPLDGAVLDALGARGSRDLETVRWRLSRDRRLARIRLDLVAAGMLGERSRWGRPDRPDRPARTASGRRLLRELRATTPPGPAWEVAVNGRAGLTDLALHESLVPPPPPPSPAQPRRRWLDPASRRPMTIEGYATGAAVVGHGAWGGGAWGGGADCGGGFDGGGGGGGGGDGGC
jgi:hypothetical protein